MLHFSLSHVFKIGDNLLSESYSTQRVLGPLPSSYTASQIQQEGMASVIVPLNTTLISWRVELFTQCLHVRVLCVSVQTVGYKE